MFRVFRDFKGDVDLTPYRAFMTELAAASGDFIRPFFGNPDLVVETKSDATPVTLADRDNERLIREAIEREFPDDGILGEEFPERPGTSGRMRISEPACSSAPRSPGSSEATV